MSDQQTIDLDKVYTMPTESVISMKPLPLGDLSLMDGKVMYKYVPKADITNIELAHLMHLWLAAMSASRHFVQYDYWSFVQKHGLERHFEEQK